MEGYHDDLLMAMGMALWVIEHAFKKLERLEKQNKAMLNSWLSSANSAQGPATTTSVDTVTGKEVTKINPQHVAYKNVQDPRGEYMWLFGGMNKQR
jgi:hypothetical protein